MILRKEFRFEASHLLSQHNGKCRNLHGHSWLLIVEVEGKVSPRSGFVMDYTDIKKAIQPLIDQLDHKHLGGYSFTELGVPEVIYYLDIPDCNRVPWLSVDFYPTSENLLLALADEISHKLDNWSRLILSETCTTQAELTRKEYTLAKRH